MSQNRAIEANHLHTSMTALLNEASGQLAVLIEKILPALYEDWWKQAVVNNLSVQQRRRIEQQKIESLATLDLAALRRVFDQNWYKISTMLPLPPDARHFVKEMQTTRNR